MRILLLVLVVILQIGCSNEEDGVVRRYKLNCTCPAQEPEEYTIQLQFKNGEGTDVTFDHDVYWNGWQYCSIPIAIYEYAIREDGEGTRYLYTLEAPWRDKDGFLHFTTIDSKRYYVVDYDSIIGREIYVNRLPLSNEASAIIKYSEIYIEIRKRCPRHGD